jgi:hypothetical protein
MAVERAIKIHVAVDECDFRIYCNLKNLSRSRSRSKGHIFVVSQIVSQIEK